MCVLSIELFAKFQMEWVASIYSDSATDFVYDRPQYGWTDINNKGLWYNA